MSFDFYEEGAPWAAYGQFCRHFLAPLLLMKYVGTDMVRLQTVFLDGVPLEVASAMLPLRTHLNPQIKANIHMHAASLRKHKESFESSRQPKLAPAYAQEYRQQPEGLHTKACSSSSRPNGATTTA